MNELPFELYRSYKARTLKNWRRTGLNIDNIDELYNKYIYCKECDWCCKPFESRNDRQMDHCHISGEFRGFLCRQCNLNANDCDNISWCNTENKYVVEIRRNGKNIFKKRCNTREEAEIVLKQFKDENWWLFPWYVPNQ